MSQANEKGEKPVVALNRALGDPWRGEFAYLAVDPTAACDRDRAADHATQPSVR